MTNIFAEISGLTGKEQEKFINWLQQYNAVAEIDCFFENHPELLSNDNATEDVDALQGLQKKTAVLPQPGQIRRLDSSLTTSADQLTAVLVLSQWSDQHWLIAPFSPYSFPATPGELATDIEFSHYAVVESWNAVVVPEIFLYTRTSFLRNADEQLRKDACTIFFQQLEGTELPKNLVDRVGPGINSEFDPRIQYLLDQKQELIPLRNAAQKAADVFSSVKAQSPFWANNDETLVLAAKDKDSNVSFWSVDKQDAVIKTFIEKSELRLQVFSSDYQSYSDLLDSWSVVSESGTVLGTIVNGRCRIQKENVAGMFCLASPNGELFILNEAEK